jgi:hypothetical protein
MDRVDFRLSLSPENMHMAINDFINGMFELGSGLFCIINIVRLKKDKKVMGVSWVPTAFFTLWGAWNLYYYPSLNQMISFIGGLAIFIANLIWVLMVFYYIYKSRK